jgi:hypothetical protein
MHRIRVINDALPYPIAHQQIALRSEFKDLRFGASTFCGIGYSTHAEQVREVMASRFPGLVVSVTFFRKSPYLQVEPNYIHSDADMGDWTGILYLNDNPPEGDGTLFWKHVASDSVCGPPRADEWRDQPRWAPWKHVQAKFNRLLLFPSDYYHSRAIPENYGVGESARLIQVMFGKGELPKLFT